MANTLKQMPESQREKILTEMGRQALYAKEVGEQLGIPQEYTSQQADLLHRVQEKLKN